MTDEVSYRRATAADAEAVAAVIGAVVAEPQPVGLDRAFSAGEVRTWIGRLGEPGLLLLAEAGGRTLGFGALDFDTREPEAALLGVWLLQRGAAAGHRHAPRRRAAGARAGGRLPPRGRAAAQRPDEQ